MDADRGGRDVAVPGLRGALGGALGWVGFVVVVALLVDRPGLLPWFAIASGIVFGGTTVAVRSALATTARQNPDHRR
ncbi:MAG: hypothetical protein ABEJ35_05950 [Halobacteriaceae archaeon]